ncbi:syntaxin-51-like [Salvia miltiorrhiza]|uniref:syntaxin-51-like n=1 Tax=Salvia miltiorrhiza TaxID=226208 RepID=UPI0025AD0939|nr:syntaxin-51-like [Salvia miltiorrhiza]XP_057767845.1 syntaxin-51-like [Salvia miltiorrhiza]
MSRASGLNNSEILHLQNQIMREQDEELEKLAETIGNTSHIAWAINEEFRLLERLDVDVNKYVEVPDSKLQQVQRRLEISYKRRRLLLFSLIGILLLAVVIIMLVKFL